MDAAIDEVVHARLVGELAAEYGVLPAQVEVQKHQERSLFDFALHNATEGCIRETYAGLEATWQAENAGESTRAVLRRIAEDECGHAELSWEIHAWALEGLSPPEAALLKQAQLEELAMLGDELLGRDSCGIPELGLPAPAESVALLDQMASTLALA